MRVLFYAGVKDKALFERTGFYVTDIAILNDLGCCVELTNRLRDFLKFWRYDLAFIYFWTKGAFGAAFARIFGKKVIFTGGIDDLDRDFNASTKRHFIRVVLFRICTKFSNANLVVSGSDLQNMLRVQPRTQNIHVTPHVIDFESYKYDGRFKENIFTTIVWMGTKGNVVRKGVDKLLHICCEFRKLSTCSYHLYIIGAEGEGTDYLKDLLQKLEISDMVTFTGSIGETEKIDILKRSKIYFQLSKFEGFGIAAIEAMAAGNMVVHSGKGALREVLQSYGYCVGDGNTDESIANAVLCLASNYEKNMNSVWSAVEHIGRNYAYAIRLNGIRKTLNLLGRKPVGEFY